LSTLSQHSQRLRGVFTMRRYTNPRLPSPSPQVLLFQPKCADI